MGTYNSKYGEVLKLTDDNYADYNLFIDAVFASTDTTGIVEGIEVLAANVTSAIRKDFNKRNGIALQLISSSVGPQHRPLIKAFVRTRDVPGMWNALAVLDRTGDPVFCRLVRETFMGIKFDVTKPIQEFVNALVVE